MGGPDRIPVPVRAAGAHDARILGGALGRAFMDDPIWSWFAPDPQRRAAHIGAVFAHLARNRIGQGSAWTTPAIAGGALWAAPGTWRVPWHVALPWLPAALRMGGRVGATRFAMSGSVMERHHPREPHWYLEVLGTDPDRQGQGVGAALIAPVLRRCDEEGVPAYLESSKPENVPWYERFGFEVTGELKLAGDAPPMWSMWRTPR